MIHKIQPSFSVYSISSNLLTNDLKSNCGIYFLPHFSQIHSGDKTIPFSGMPLHLINLDLISGYFCTKKIVQSNFFFFFYYLCLKSRTKYSLKLNDNVKYVTYGDLF